MIKRGFFTLSVVVFICILLVGCKKTEPSFECTDSIGCVTIAPSEPIEIGVIQDLSGGAADFGAEQVGTIKLAVAGWDNQLHGHPIELQIVDEGCLPEGGKNAALKFATRPRTVAIIGTTCSGAGAAASRVMSVAGLVMISGCNSAASLTSVQGKKGPDWQPGYFSTRYSDMELGRGPAIYAFRELGARKAATINKGDTYTQGLTDVFAYVFTALGGKVVLDAAVNRGDTDMRPVLTAVANSGAQLLFFPIFRPEGDFIVHRDKRPRHEGRHYPYDGYRYVNG